MITLLKILPEKWEQAKGYLRLDLEAIEAAMNTRWAQTFGANNLLNPDTIQDWEDTPTRYIANTATDPEGWPKWDQVNLSNGVKNRLPFSNFVAATAGSKLVGRGLGAAGDFEEISLGPGLVMASTTLQVDLSRLAGSIPLPDEPYPDDPWPMQSTPAAASYTTGSVLFAGTDGLPTQDNSNLFWDNGNNRLGVGTNSPSEELDVRGTTPIVGAHWSANTGFGSYRFFESTTLFAAVQTIGSNFATSARRNSLELFNLTATGSITFHVNNSSTPQMMLNSSGVLGIGITSSFLANRVHVSGTVSATDVCFFSANSSTTNLATDFGQLAVDNPNTTNNSYTSMFFTSRHADNSILYGAAIQSQTTSHTNGAGTATLIFKTRNAGTLTERARLDVNGLTLATALTVPNGGTGLTTTTQGDIFYGAASNTIAKLAKSASATRYLSNTGASNDPAWAQVDLSNGVTGVLPTANGGTSVNIASAALPLGSGQIAFPATQNPSADANTLDDYEEGTWTPTIGGSTSESGQAYTTQAGVYTKVGNLVTVGFNIVLSTRGTITGTVQVKGLPFTAGGFGVCNFLYYQNMTTAITGLGGYIDATLSVLNLFHTAGVTAGVLFPVQADLSNTTQIAGSITYRV